MTEDSKNELVDDGTTDLESLAHDVRGSLHAMKMGRELLKHLYPDTRLLEVCDAMEDEERRVSELVDKLLTAARGEA
jgi:signal transduction histidine kinase